VHGNGLVRCGFQGCYITIHVTPQPECSYVSFESNVPQESYHDLIEKVLEVFNPGQFLMTIFANKVSDDFFFTHSFSLCQCFKLGRDLA
jgi:hypothetical protein